MGTCKSVDVEAGGVGEGACPLTDCPSAPPCLSSNHIFAPVIWMSRELICLYKGYQCVSTLSV